MNVYLYQYIIATPILIIHVFLVVLMILMITGYGEKVTNHAKKYGLTYGLIIAIAALLGSLGFSEGYAYEPCKLCWIQRIFHYPQLFLFAIALLKKDSKVWTYSIWLSSVGFLIAIYQILLQFVPTLSEATICSLIPAAANCSDILIQAYGYISIPVMSATLFLCLIVLYFNQNKK